MLTLTEAFKREAAKTGAHRTHLVEFVGLSGMRKFVTGSRRILGYFPLVESVNPRSASLDPLRCTQSVSAVEIELRDGSDGILRALVAANKLFGKQIKVTVGFDTSDDATFLESDYAGFSSGVITDVEAVEGGIRIVAKDARASILSKGGTQILVPRPGTVNGQQVSFSEQGAATLALKDLLIAAGLSATHHYNAASYAIAASPGCGHLTLDRFKYRGRDLTVPTPVEDLLSEISAILRGYNLLQEDGLITWKEVDTAGAIAGRFVEKDIIPGTFKVRSDFSRIVNAVSIRSAHENLDGGSGGSLVLPGVGGFRVELRDDDTAAQADWEFSDGTDQVAEFALEDYWFSSVAPTKDSAAIPTGTGTIDIVDTNFAGSTIASPAPNVVDASHPGYVLVRGYRSSTEIQALGPAPIEVIKYTTITSPSAGHLRLGGITRAQFGTTEVAHSNALFGNTLVIGPVVVDVTAIVRCADLVLRRFKDGGTLVEFKTALPPYAFQLADLTYLEHPAFLRYGQSGLAAGNTTTYFEVIRKDVDWDGGEITWSLIEVRVPSRTPIIKGGANWTGVPGFDTDLAAGIAKLGNWFMAPQSSGSGSLAQAFIDATAPAVSITLGTTVPTNRALTRAGFVSIQAEAHTFTASKDTYVDLVPYPGGKSHWRYTEVANGAGAPALATGELRAFKVVTSGTAVTGVTSQAATQLVDGPNLKTGDVGGVGALSKVDATGRLVDPVIKDTDASPVADVKLKVKQKKLKTTDTSDVDVTTVWATPTKFEKPFYAGKQWADGMPFASVIDRPGTNYCKNPSFETDVTLWQEYSPDASATAPTLSRDTSQRIFGAASLKVANADTVWTGFIGAEITKAAAPTVVAGEFWCASGWVRTNNRVLVKIFVTNFTSADAFVNETGFTVDVPASTWVPLNLICDVVGAVGAGGYALLRIAVATPNVAFDMFIDGVVLEKSAKPSTYFDGSLGEGFSWSGTPHLSTSTRDGGLNNHGAMAADSEPFAIYDDGEVQCGPISPSVGSAAKIGLSGAPLRIAGAGTVFPPTPTTNDTFFRTDRGILYYYDGTRWLSVHEYTMVDGVYTGLPGTALAATTNPHKVVATPWAGGGTKVYFTTASFMWFVATTHSSTQYWNIGLAARGAANFVSFNTKDTSTAINTWVRTEMAINAERTIATDVGYDTNCTKVSTPGNLNLPCAVIHFRLVG